MVLSLATYSLVYQFENGLCESAEFRAIVSKTVVPKDKNRLNCQSVSTAFMRCVPFAPVYSGAFFYVADYALLKRVCQIFGFSISQVC